MTDKPVMELTGAPNLAGQLSVSLGEWMAGVTVEGAFQRCAWKIGDLLRVEPITNGG